MLPFLFLVVSCGRGEFDESSVDRGGDPGPPWLNDDDENSDPVANDDSAHTFDGYHTIINVLANDTDPDFDSLSITNVASPDGGDAELNEDGTITYTPNNSFEGVDTFKYTVEDGKGGSAKGTVTVDVTGPATVTITSPEDQDVVTIPFDIEFEFTGACELVLSDENDQGCHIHLILDGSENNFPDLDGDGFPDAAYDPNPLQVLETGEGLSPGMHTLELVLWRNDAAHGPYDPRISHEITIYMPEDTGADTGDTADTADTSDTGGLDTGYTDTGDTAN